MKPTLLVLVALVALPAARLGADAFSVEHFASAAVQSAAPQAPSIDDAVLWREFEEFSTSLRHLPPGQRSTMDTAYAGWLATRGVAKDEALARLARVNITRRGSIERERIYWNVAFKLGGGPDQPLRFLQEVVKDLKPGRALDPGMGRGRNAIYLASIGWDVTGYDNAPDALTAAHNYASQAGVKLKTVLASHDEFDYGVEQWDLIVNTYNFIDPVGSQWPEKQWRALKPGGLVVWQSAVVPPNNPDPEFGPKFVTAWRLFRVLRFEQPEGTSDDWMPSAPHFRAVLKKAR